MKRRIQDALVGAACLGLSVLAWGLELWGNSEPPKGQAR